MRLRELVHNIFGWVKSELKDEENGEMIQREIVDPMIQTILQKIYPYLIVSSAAFLLVFIGLISILVILFQIPRVTSVISTASTPALDAVAATTS